MDKIRMKCDRCDFGGDINSSDVKETKAKVPFYRCPRCNIGSLTPVNPNGND